MRTLLQVLAEAERDKVHEQTLKLLSQTGMRVDTSWGRRILRAAGADVSESTHIVRFPPALVKASLQAAPRKFTLGGRRPNWNLTLNEGECTLLADGGAVFVLDPQTAQPRPGAFDDWLAATRLIDALDDIGIYWWMVKGGLAGDSLGDAVAYWRNVFGNFSKHVQDATYTPEQSRWMLEVLQAIFGDKETIRRLHPMSFLLCPLSPLVIEESYTDAYLEIVTAGYDVPVAVMPMPLMGATSPGSLISTIVLGNCEALAMLCLVQAAAPGTPFIYAPALAAMEPRSGRYGSGAVEHALLGAAATEMARYYDLPVEASTGGTDHHVPGIQAGYERAINWTLPTLAWPDILVGPGLLGGSMILCLEQLMIDVEVFGRCKQLHRGVQSDEGRWLEDVTASVEPGGDFVSQRSTRDAVHAGEWHISQLGVHDAFEKWEAAGKPDLLQEAREKVAQILATHQPLPLDEAVERELSRIERRARESASRG
jgi:trimethylamine--corrinoid protein Co-methyltransferase